MCGSLKISFNLIRARNIDFGGLVIDILHMWACGSPPRVIGLQALSNNQPQIEYAEAVTAGETALFKQL